MRSINQTYTIKAPIAQVWQCLVDPARIDEWGGGPARMSDQEGSEFSLWGGDIHGSNTKVSAPHLLEQAWYEKAWDRPSHVLFELIEHGAKTTLHLHHETSPRPSSTTWPTAGAIIIWGLFGSCSKAIRVLFNPM